MSAWLHQHFGEIQDGHAKPSQQCVGQGRDQDRSEIEKQVTVTFGERLKDKNSYHRAHGVHRVFLRGFLRGLCGLRGEIFYATSFVKVTVT